MLTTNLAEALPTAFNLTRPDGIHAVRFVKNKDGMTFNWYSQDLEEGSTLLTAANVTAGDVTYIAGMLEMRGWK